MQVDVARAQVETLNEWATLYEREGNEVAGNGATEVAFLLQRAGRMILKIIGDAPGEPEVPAAEVLPEPVSADELRDG